MSSGPLDEVEYDLNHEDDIDETLNISQSLLSLSYRLVLITYFDLVDIWESHNKWSHNQVVDGYKVDDKVPSFGKVSLSVYKIPLYSWLISVVLAVVTHVFLIIVDHHVLLV